MSNSNERLIYGSGTGNPSIGTVWKCTIIYAILCIASFLIAAFFFQSIGEQHSPQTKMVGSFIPIKTGNAEAANYFNTLYYVTIAFGITLFIWFLFWGNTVSKRIQTTEVSVYEDKVKGVAFDKDSSIDKMFILATGVKLTNFNLAFSQITSVDLYDHVIIINASGAKYKCFVSNSSEIQDVINNKIRNRR